MIQDELDRLAQQWNLHCIRSQHNVQCSLGRADTLFFLPELEGDFVINHCLLKTQFDLARVRASGLKFTEN